MQQQEKLPTHNPTIQNTNPSSHHLYPPNAHHPRHPQRTHARMRHSAITTTCLQNPCASRAVTVGDARLLRNAAENYLKFEKVLVIIRDLPGYYLRFLLASIDNRH
uniref:Bm12155 n=1 Tax=Brugia malayi TaxID=6279 RepID=A0A1I9GAG1_BRUMA|nr:Bm12155 [Brugia malayi]